MFGFIVFIECMILIVVCVCGGELRKLDSIVL